ncbi:hypothetical protein [Nocardia sp. BMG51109]|uniref:hypothetical protein n=1 Tax=Nocardia sp. BMG51109 TaxID=1056816 RepID=UPI00046443C2|nr:hypothetical protein [Nocardia sp. BMG51109]
MTALNATTASKTPRRAAVVVALAAGAALALSGCSAGQMSQTASQVAAVNGNSADVGRVALRDVRILLPQSEQYTNAKGGKAVLAFSAVNDAAEPDRLASITSDLGTVKITPANPELKFQQTLVAAGPQAGAAAHEAAPTGSAAPSSSSAPTSSAESTSSAAPTGSAHAESTGSAHAEGLGVAEHPAEPASPVLVEIDGLTKDVAPGLTYQVTFNFKESGTVSVHVPVDAGPDTARKEGGPAAAEGAAGEHKGGH